MGRPRVHRDEVVLDAARDLILDGGTAGASTAAISARCAAPIGSLYHRFGSRHGLLAQLWIRTVHRFQAGLLTASADAAPGLPRALAAAAWTVDFASTHPEDARLLLLTSWRELHRDPHLPSSLRAILAELNQPVLTLLRQLADQLGGTQALDRVTIAVVDLPYATVRRHLLTGTDPASSRSVLLTSVRAVLEASP